MYVVPDTDSTDAGLLRQATVGGVTHRYIEPSTTNAAAVFSSLASAGTGGAFDEKGRKAAHLALTTNVADPRNIGFYRPDATLHLVFLSDEDDQTVTPTTSDFLTWMDTVKPNPDHVQSHAIVGLPGQSCNVVMTEGLAYIDYAHHTDGLLTDICAQDWSPLMGDIGLRASGARREFFLLNPAAPGSAVEVSVLNPALGVVRNFTASDFTYDPTRASIVFDAYVPEPGSVVRLSYTPE